MDTSIAGLLAHILKGEATAFAAANELVSIDPLPPEVGRMLISELLRSSQELNPAVHYILWQLCSLDERMVRDVLELTHHSSSEIRKSAWDIIDSTVLSELSRSMILPYVYEGIDDESEDISQIALSLLAQALTVETLPGWLEVMSSERKLNSDVLFALEASLHRLGADAVPYLTQVAGEEASPLRVSAIGCLAMIRDLGTLPVLLDCLQSDDLSVKRTATLTEHLLFPDPFVRLEAAYALLASGNPAAQEYVRALLQDETLWVQKAIQRALARFEQAA